MHSVKYFDIFWYGSADLETSEKSTVFGFLGLWVVFGIITHHQY